MCEWRWEVWPMKNEEKYVWIWCEGWRLFYSIVKIYNEIQCVITQYWKNEENTEKMTSREILLMKTIQYNINYYIINQYNYEGQ